MSVDNCIVLAYFRKTSENAHTHTDSKRQRWASNEMCQFTIKTRVLFVSEQHGHNMYWSDVITIVLCLSVTVPVSVLTGYGLDGDLQMLIKTVPVLREPLKRMKRMIDLHLIFSAVSMLPFKYIHVPDFNHFEVCAINQCLNLSSTSWEHLNQRGYIWFRF